MKARPKNVKNFLHLRVKKNYQAPNSGGPPTTFACQELFSSKIRRKVAITPRKSPKDLTNFFTALEGKRLDTAAKTWYNRRLPRLTGIFYTFALKKT